MAAPPPSEALRATTPLADALEDALGAGDERELRAATDIHPVGRRDAALALSLLHDLHLAPVHDLGDRAAFQHHPVVAELKQRLEQAFLRRLPTGPVPARGD